MQIFVGIFFSPPVSYFSFLFVYNCRRNRWQQQRQQQQRRQQRRHSKSSYGLGLCLPACCDVSSFIYICFILLSWLTGAFAVCARARSLGVGFRPARTPPTGRRHPPPCHLSRIVPNSTFCNYKNPGKSSGKWGKAAQQAACWGFVVLVKICCSHFDCSLYCCCCCFR